MGRKFTLEEEENLKKLGAELKRIRKSKSERVTLADVSKGTHIKADYISKYENGKKEIGYLALKKLCDFYKTDVSTLLCKIEKAPDDKFNNLIETLKKSARAIISQADDLNQEYIRKSIK